MRTLIISLTLLVSNLAQAESIFEAVQGGDVRTIQSYLDQGGDPNLKDVRGDSLLIYALRFKQPLIQKLVCAHGAKDFACLSDYDKKKSEILALELRNKPNLAAQEFEALLAQGADPSFSTLNSRPAMFWAISFSRLDLVLLLLKYGSHIDMNYYIAASGTYAGSPLVWALQDGNLPIASLLLEYGANPAIEGTDTAVSMSRNSYALAMTKLSDSQFLTRLLQQTQKRDLVPLLVKISCSFNRPTTSQIKTFFPIFFSFGVDVNYARGKESVAQCIAETEDLSSLQAIADLGANFALIKHLNTGLKDEVLDFMIAHGAKASILNLINVVGTSREQKFVAAANTQEIYNGEPGIFAPFKITDSGTNCEGEQALLELLIRAGFDLNARMLTPQNGGRQPTLLEACLEEPQVRRTLLKAGADPNLFDSSRVKNSLFIASDLIVLGELLIAGGNLNLKNGAGLTAAHYLLDGKWDKRPLRFNRKLFELFRKHGLDFSILTADDRSYLYLYLNQNWAAVDAGLLEDIADQFPKALSIKGPNPQDLRRSKATPIVFLLLANDATRMDVLDVFIKKGADLNSQETYYGRTFLHGLLNNLIYGNFDWLKMFEAALRAKADPDIKDLSGDSVRSIAKARKRQDLLDYIERYAPEH